MTNVERITVLRRREGSDRLEPQILYWAPPSSRRDDWEYRGWLEDATYTAAAAAETSARSYTRNHARSNRRGPDGWLYDLPDNLWTAWLDGKRRIWNR